MIPVTVLRSGGEYGPKHVKWLAKQVPGLVCLSDVPIEGVETVELRHDWPKWWAKIELFSDVFSEDLLFFDLDTVVLTDDLSPFEVGKTTLLSDFYRPQYAASGLMYIAERDKSPVFDAFLADPDGMMAKYRRFPLIGDQGFLHDHLKCSRWQNLRPGLVQSFKVHCRTSDPTAKIVCFHGQPRPWNVKRDWIPQWS